MVQSLRDSVGTFLGATNKGNRALKSAKFQVTMKKFQLKFTTTSIVLQVSRQHPQISNLRPFGRKGTTGSAPMQRKCRYGYSMDTTIPDPVQKVSILMSYREYQIIHSRVERKLANTFAVFRVESLSKHVQPLFRAMNVMAQLI